MYSNCLTIIDNYDILIIDNYDAHKRGRAKTMTISEYMQAVEEQDAATAKAWTTFEQAVEEMDEAWATFRATGKLQDFRVYSRLATAKDEAFRAWRAADLAVIEWK